MNNLIITSEDLTIIEEVAHNANVNYDKLLNLVNEKLTAVNASNITNPHKYIKTIAIRLTEERLTELTDERKIISTVQLHLAMQQLEFTGTQEEFELIDNVLDYAVNEGNVDCQELKQLNHKAFDYCISKKDKTYKYFLDLLLHSKLLNKIDFPIDKLKAKAKKSVKEWLELLQELNSDEEERNDTICPN